METISRTFWAAKDVAWTCGPINHLITAVGGNFTPIQGRPEPGIGGPNSRHEAKSKWELGIAL